MILIRYSYSYSYVVKSGNESLIDQSEAENEEQHAIISLLNSINPNVVPSLPKSVKYLGASRGNLLVI